MKTVFFADGFACFYKGEVYEIQQGADYGFKLVERDHKS